MKKEKKLRQKIMFKTIIVEDEYYARLELKRMIGETGKFEIMATCENAVEALKEINKHHPDILFLDIHLPMIDGFELLSMIEPSILPRIVFVTAYDEYAVKAFEENAVDYLLKPVDKTRLAKTTEKVTAALIHEKETKEHLQEIKIPPLKRIPSCLGKKIKFIDLDSIEYVSTTEKGTFAFCSKDSYFTDLTLKVLEARSSLLRCHKQYLINPVKINEIVLEENQSGNIITVSGRFVPVSRSYLKKIREKLMT